MTASGRFSPAIWEMVMGNSSGWSLAVLVVCLRRDPQYQQTRRVKAKMAIPATIQNRIEKMEVVERVSSISWGISLSVTVTLWRLPIEVLRRLTWSSRCVASLISSEGRVSGLKAHEKRSGSGLILMLWSERRVWLKSFREQPGLTWILEVVWTRIG